MNRRAAIPFLAVLAVTALAAASVILASSNAPSASPAPDLALTSGSSLPTGNYCVSCHLADDPRLASVTGWSGGIEREVNSPCPAATAIHAQLYYTERMLLMIDRAEHSIGALSAKNQALLANDTQLYNRLLDEPVTSAAAFTATAQTARYRLEKIYTVLTQMSDVKKQHWVLFWAGVVTLIVLGSLLWGLANTRAAGREAASGPRSPLGTALALLLVLAIFSLPILRVPAAEGTAQTAEQQEAQAALDAANRAASAADNAQARIWMLAGFGASWSARDPAQAQAAFSAALASIQQAEANGPVLWGKALGAEEAAGGAAIDVQKADLAAASIDAARTRAWSVPLAAVDWLKVDPAQAKALLQAETRSLLPQRGIYRDMQLRGVALAWARIDPAQAGPAAGMIQDAALRAWTLREAAQLLKDPSLYQQAAEAARQVPDPVQRARALRELAAASGDPGLFREARAALQGARGAPLAYALSDLAAASGDAALVAQIDPAYPDARAAALSGLGQYPAAWDAAAAIADPYERARAQASIAGKWGDAGAAMKIQVPLYRDLALRDILRQNGDAALAGAIQSPYTRVQAFTALGEFSQAAREGGKLGDSYPLVGLVAGLAKGDPQAASSLAGAITSPADKAAALRVIAAATGDPALFKRALDTALAARVSGDALSPARASLDLANAFWQINPGEAGSALRQAVEAALRISVQ